MIVVTYKEIDKEGTVQLPFKYIDIAKTHADKLYRDGYLNVKVVEVEEKVLYEPGVK